MKITYLIDLYIHASTYLIDLYIHASTYLMTLRYVYHYYLDLIKCNLLIQMDVGNTYLCIGYVHR